MAEKRKKKMKSQSSLEPEIEMITPSLPVFEETNSNAETHKTDKLKVKQTEQKKDVDTNMEKVDEAVTHDLSNQNVKSKSFRWKMKKVQEDSRSGRLREDLYPGDAPVSKETIQKYKRGEKMELKTVKTGFHKEKYKRVEKKISNAARQAARTELLLHEEAGFLEADEGEETTDITQKDITQAVDIASAQKHFDLKLDQFGPYRCKYTRNGRYMLLGGGRGHVAAFDWQTKKLMCEMNVMETVRDVQWFHIETMFAVAQKEWTYVYDNQGIELHCLKNMSQVLRMEFLPYHFLLVSGNARGYVTYLDVSVGQKVAGFPTGLGRLDVMCQNPKNAIVHMGHSGGTVTLWSPNVKEPLVKMLCHGGGTRSVAVDHTGWYMATSGIDRKLKIWDLRTYKELHSYKVSAGAGDMSFSQRGLLATGVGNVVEVYKDILTSTVCKPYMSQRMRSSVQNVNFCPYEDVLGVGHSAGYTSLLIPGAGEPNFDALEANPYQSKKQRQQAEVKMLLEKIQPDMINLDTGILGQMDRKTLLETMEEKKKLAFLKPEKIEFEPKFKKKGRSKTGNLMKRKQKVHADVSRQQIREIVQKKQSEAREDKQDEARKTYSALDRFKQKT